MARLTVTLTGLLVALAAISGCDKAAEAPAGPPPVKPVKTVVIGGGGIGGLRTFPGRVDAAQTVELSFSVAGKLQELPIKEGQTVAAGDIVAQLDPTDFETNVSDQQASYDRANADFTRAKELIGKGFISRQNYDSLEAQFKSAAAALKRAQTDLGYTTLTAPFSGRVAQRYVENFTEVQAKEAIMAIQDVDTLEVKISLPENLVRRARRDDDGKLPAISARFEGISGRTFPLTFKEVATRADPETQTFEVTLSLKDPEGVALLPGMTASVDVNFETRLSGGGHAVPVSAVVGDTKKKPTVWIVNEEAMTVSPRPVQIGPMSGQSITVTEGLKDGERIVVAGVSFLRDGMKVRLMPEKEQATQ